MLESTPADEFRHEALVYASAAAFLTATTAFLRAGIAGGEALMVAVDQPKIDLLRANLDGEADQIDFVDMTEIGRNPATIIPVWQDFIDAHSASGRRLRGIGEPAWPGRSATELVECHHHEALLNVAFAPSTPLFLLCPYDASELGSTALASATHTHPFVDHGDGAQRSEHFDPARVTDPFTGPLSEVPPGAAELSFDGSQLRSCRWFLEDQASWAGLDSGRTAALAVAVSEIATNSIVHGGGEGVIRTWSADRIFVCEVADRGRITDPMAGRRRPLPDGPSGRGLWLTNHLCDLVQVRSGPAGVVVRLHMSLV